MSTILIAGGAGYIGSHMAWHLYDKSEKIIVLDNFSSGSRELLPSDITIIEGSIGDARLLEKIFSEYTISAVMHFAAFIEVGESVTNPAKYYKNNVLDTITLLDVMRKHDVNYFIFSSTAATYGEPQYTPIDLQHPNLPLNPYGRSKLMVEQILADYDTAYGLKSVCLRYFNACGADPKGRTGECHDPESHLIPIILQVANGRRAAIKIFGDDYPTPDGTCVRDYIHIVDLCSAHDLALRKLMQSNDSKRYNLGNGQGFSVKQVIDTVADVTGKSIKVESAARRAGDPAILVADASAAINELGWQPQYPNLRDIIKHAWAWEQQCY
jgi:UDP-glucose 4-epimerase